MRKLLSVFLFSLLLVTFSYAAEPNDPLPSWNNNPVKQNIIKFVQAVTDKASKDYVAPEDRIATIDNDGTLWVEQPMYTQVIFMLDRFKQMANKHPEWQQQQQIKAILNGKYEDLTGQDLDRIFTVTSTGMSVEDYNNMTKQWLATAEDPRFKKHFTQLVYQPMLEVMNYLRANDFKIYIVNGGGQDFMRAFAQDTYGVPPEQVIGSTSKSEYTYKKGKATITKLPEVLFISDKTGKPEAINLFIGKKPIIAFGNSIGDKEMFEWTQTGKGKKLILLIHHDDSEREYAYDTRSKIGTFPTSMFEAAKKNRWQIVSMKDDWKVIFPDNPSL